MSFVIPLRPGCLEAPDRFDVIPIEAAMLWPDDPETRDGAACSSALEWFRHQPRPREVPSELVDLAADALPIKHWQHGDAIKDRMIHGMIAGDILHCALCISQCDPARAAIRTAMEEAARAYNLKEMSDGGRTARISVKTIKNSVWPRFRPVAHLWAAWGTRSTKEVPCRHEALGDFLALAESYRALGEQTHTKQSPGFSILRPGESVMLPDYIEVAPYPLQFMLERPLK